jgi:serine protease Do
VLLAGRSVQAAVPAQQATPAPATTGDTTAADLETTATVAAPSPLSGDFNLVETDFATFLLPSTWVDSMEEVDEAEGTFTYTAAPDLDALEDLSGDQGAIVLVQAAEQWVDPVEVLDSFQTPSEACVFTARMETSHTFAGLRYEGLYDEWYACPGEGISFYVLVLQSDGIDAAVFAIFFAPTESSALAYNIFRNTLAITTPPPLERPLRPSTPPAGERPTPAPTPTEPPPTPVVDDDVAVVVPDRLNVRSGPGIQYDRVTAVEREDQLMILGRNPDCTWLNITTPDGVEGWVAAAAQFVTFGGVCSALPEVATPPLPPTATPSPTATATPSEMAAPSPTAAPSPVASPSPEPTPLPSPTEPEAEPALGCYLFENQIDDEVTITFTRRQDSWNTTFRLPKGISEVRCFEPGDYTYTLDAPPPWTAVNGELRVVAGEHRFPIRAE